MRAGAPGPGAGVPDRTGQEGPAQVGTRLVHPGAVRPRERDLRRPTLNFTKATDAEKRDAAWDLQHEDELGPEDEFTIPEAIVLIARQRGWI